MRIIQTVVLVYGLLWGKFRVIIMSFSRISLTRETLFFRDFIDSGFSLVKHENLENSGAWLTWTEHWYFTIGKYSNALWTYRTTYFPSILCFFTVCQSVMYLCKKQKTTNKTTYGAGKGLGSLWCSTRDVSTPGLMTWQAEGGPFITTAFIL